MTAVTETSEITREVERSIHFFWAANEFVDGHMKRFNFADLCRDIGGLEPQLRYMTSKDGTVTTSRLFNPSDTDRLILGKVRRDELPPTETFGGEWGMLQLPENVGLADVIHIRFFDNNVVGVEFNRDGPWPTKLRDYAQDRFGKKYANFHMAAILDKNAMERLNRIDRVKGVDISLSQATLNHIPTPQANDFLDAIKKIPGIGDAGVIRIGWHTYKPSEILNTGDMKRLVTFLLENRGYFDKKARIKIVGFDIDNKRQEFDLVEDRVVTTHGVLKIGRERCVDSKSAFRAIEDAYTQCKERFPLQKFAR